MFSRDEAATKAESGMERNPSLDTAPMAPTIEDQLDKIHALLERMLELAAEAAGEGDPDREALQQELDRLRYQIDRIADNIDYGVVSGMEQEENI